MTQHEAEVIGRLKAIELILAQSLAFDLIPLSPKDRFQMTKDLTGEMEKRLPELSEDSRPHATKSADWIIKSAYNTAQQFQR